MVEKLEFSLAKLLRSILTISVLGFGGGAAVIPLFHKEFVEKYKWLSDDEFQDILSVSNALPGPIQTKIAGYIGFRLKGILGMITSLLCIILPSLFAMLIFYNTINYYKDELWVSSAISSVLPVVTVLMLLLSISFLKKSSKKLNTLSNLMLIALSAIAIVLLKINPAILIIIILLAVFIPAKNDNMRFGLIGFLILLVYLISYFLTNSIDFNLGLDISNSSNLFKVFYSFFVPGVLGYGGGPGSLSLISYEVVDHVQLLTSDQFGLVVAIQASLPGVTATKLAGTIGFQAAGIIGSLVGVFVYVTPSMILMVTLLKLLNKYKNSPTVKRLTSFVGPVIFVLLVQLTVNFFLSSLDALGWIYTLIFISVNIVLLAKLKIHPFFAILISMGAGIIIALI